VGKLAFGWVLEDISGRELTEDGRLCEVFGIF
jgi:hypothetical protein